ncbi:hypothetical protein GCM10023188_44680 [Pontibacter saemangeumensis]|uniref:Thioredoxin domain-containing protein n=2 Tax=Pontibacter saemangeumensis TaxID=1084525 RepID=A0ABP8M3Y6_9BACT
MSKAKALILGFLLLVPLLIFAFISIFGVHHFTLKTYFPEVDMSGEVIYDASGDTVFQQVPDFSLTSLQRGQFTALDLKGAITVVQFFETACPECSEISSQLVRLQEAFEEFPEVKFVSITVNPERDSTAVLQQYAATYGAKAGKWYVLTGDREEILALAQQGFRLPVGKQRVLVTENLMLLDKERKVRGIYNGTKQKEIDRLVTEINVLRDEYGKRK